MELPDSPTMPGLIMGNTTTLAPPPLSIPPSLMSPPSSSMSADQAALIKIVTDIVTRKPNTQEEVVELFHTLQVQLGTWLVSELPAIEQKAVLAGLWAVEEVTSSSCFRFWKK